MGLFLGWLVTAFDEQLKHFEIVVYGCDQYIELLVVFQGNLLSLAVLVTYDKLLWQFSEKLSDLLKDMQERLATLEVIDMNFLAVDEFQNHSFYL